MAKVVVLTLSDAEEYVVKKILDVLTDENIPHEIVTSVSSNEIIYVGRLEVCPDKRKVYLGEEEIKLTTREFDLLHFLASHNEQVFTVRQIYEGITNEPFVDTYKSLESCLYRLRKKIGADLIVNVRGYGYKFQMNTN